MPDLNNLSTGIQSSRRHLVKMGVIAASAAFASLTRIKPAAANVFPSNGAPTPPPGLGSILQRFFSFGGFTNQPPSPQLSLFEGFEGVPQSPHNCFLRGTTIRTADGDRKVENLAVGDLLPTVFGGVCPIQWIGRFPFKRSDPTRAWVKDILPVQIARSALGPDIPHADLYVTKAHALLIDGVLVAVGSLINGTTITLYDARELDELEFFHIKLASHDVIYAEGAPCETLLDVDDNAVNFSEYLHRYGASAKGAPCAPLLAFNGGRSEIKSRFRSAISPWIDRRRQLDIIRDRLEERGIALLRQPELVS
ncbi:MAG TPA: Hint domain-containing protein [Stellaceae bacterium]|nr:Hint domain-containing protein [Stellaceae bacterium]